MIDIAEQICLAVDEIVTKRLESINYDTTIVGTIVDNSQAKNYYYTCSNGSSQFIAYSQDTTYKINDSVQITIPNNDYDQQKIIIGKYVAKEDKPYVFTQPFSTIIDVSSNLINDNIETISASLLANDDYDRNENNQLIQPNEYGKYPIKTKEVPLWSKVFKEGYADFNRLGIQGQFRSWLSSLKAISGNYGYKLELLSNNGEIIENNTLLLEWIELYNKILKNENINNPGLMDNTPEDWYNKVKDILKLEVETGSSFKNTFINVYEQESNIANKKNMIYSILYANMQITEIYLDSMEDMYGNPFNFQSFFEQEKVYDISSIGTIYGMALFFYEDSGSFYSESNKYLKYRTATGTKIPPNLFTKDPYICLGYDLSSFNKEEAILYTLDGKTYVVKDEVDQNLNKKVIRLRWLHQFKNSQIKVVSESSELENYEIRWYRFKMGAPSADEYSGVYWKRVQPSETSDFMYVLQPEVNSSIEQIKVIILHEGKVIRSNILEFTNEKETANSATAELLAGLSIWCKDNSYGNYFIYGQNNNLLDESKTNEILTAEARFADASILAENYDIDAESPPLTEAKEIIWEFPLNNSMIVLHGFNYNFLYEFSDVQRAELLDKNGKILYNRLQELLNGKDDIFKLPGYFTDATIKVNNDIIYIIRQSDADGKINNLQDYRVNKTYSANKIKNTIECSIKKNGLIYSASKEFSFGLMGTNGADATVVIDFDNNISALTANIEESVKLTARLYDRNHDEVDFNNSDLGLSCEWKWAYYHQFSNEQEEEILAKALVDQGLKAEELTSIQLHQIRAEAVAKAGSVKIEETFANTCYLGHAPGLTMNNNGIFMIIQATIKGWGNYDLVAYKAIPIRATRNYRYIVGPTEIIYNSAGYIDYYKGPYELYYAETVNEYDGVPSEIEITQKTGKWQIFDPYWEEEEENKYIGIINENTNILQPASMYFENTEPYGAVCYIGNNPVWIQPLVVMQNRYPSSTINKWDGKSIEINETEGYILSPAIAAGKKHSDNSFSGVMIGDWTDKDATIGGTAEEITKQTGIYGFNYGAMSYAFKEDGTAFIGKDGRGRIYFDGNDAKIYSASYENGAGMMIDLGGDDEEPFIDIIAPGSRILLQAKQGASGIQFTGTGGHITISSDSEDYPLSIGTKFKVDWDGDLTANNATFNNAFVSGEVAANEGVIGGWAINGQMLQGGTTTFDADGNYSWTASEPAIYLDAPNAAICGGRLKPSLDGSKMEVWGSLEIRKEDGSALTGVSGNYIGHVVSGLPDKNGNIINAHGIGMSVEGAGTLKVTTANIGLQFNGDPTSGEPVSGGFISISNQAVTLLSEESIIAIYGSNIMLDNTQFKIIGLKPEQQEGIYARFA